MTLQQERKQCILDAVERRFISNIRWIVKNYKYGAANYELKLTDIYQPYMSILYGALDILNIKYSIELHRASGEQETRYLFIFKD